MPHGSAPYWKETHMMYLAAAVIFDFVAWRARKQNNSITPVAAVGGFVSLACWLAH